MKAGIARLGNALLSGVVGCAGQAATAQSHEQQQDRTKILHLNPLLYIGTEMLAHLCSARMLTEAE
jgi:hypothetical protein